MANNRLYIRCKQCGETLAIGKHFNDAMYTYGDITEHLNRFYEKHYYCQPGNGRMYNLELCEEFPGQMTDNPVDDLGNFWLADGERIQRETTYTETSECLHGTDCPAKKCNHCGELSPEDASYCIRCGYRLFRAERAENDQ